MHWIAGHLTNKKLTIAVLSNCVLKQVLGLLSIHVDVKIRAAKVRSLTRR